MPERWRCSRGKREPPRPAPSVLARYPMSDHDELLREFLIESHENLDRLEAMLHRLGVFYFRQIAAFGKAELARVNSELNEFKGRIEHDDWVGQAKELHRRKYGSDECLASA